MYFVGIYVPKKNPLTMTVPTVSKLNVVNTVLRVEDFRTPQAITTENRYPDILLFYCIMH